VPADDASLQAAVLAEMFDVATVQPVGLDPEDQQILWAIHDFGGGEAHIVTWRMRELPGIAPFLVGSSPVGGSDVVVTG
jgi:hypothetical protein